MRRIEVQRETWPLKNKFTIARGTRTEISVIIVKIADGDLVGRGECFPHSRYGESLESVESQIASLSESIEAGLSRQKLLTTLAPGAARNAIDCALWDLEAKAARFECPEVRAWTIAGIDQFQPVQSVMTISLDDCDTMAAAAKAAVAVGYDRLKVKLGGGDGCDDERINAVRSGAEGASLIVDANEGWQPEELARYMTAMRLADICMVEQPLPASADDALRGRDFGVPIGADESFKTRQDLNALVGKYNVVNIKLDKSGGLTEALLAAEEAKRRGFGVMVGCMLGTSLAMAPATIVAQRASYVDLDGPLWLSDDRTHGITFEHGRIDGFSSKLWG
jgi:L-alanine-DL-glutamate epimerase-like enolase superfamily enzyme